MPYPPRWTLVTYCHLLLLPMALSILRPLTSAELTNERTRRAVNGDLESMVEGLRGQRKQIGASEVGGELLSLSHADIAQEKAAGAMGGGPNGSILLEIEKSGSRNAQNQIGTENVTLPSDVPMEEITIEAEESIELIEKEEGERLPATTTALLVLRVLVVQKVAAGNEDSEDGDDDDDDDDLESQVSSGVNLTLIECPSNRSRRSSVRGLAAAPQRPKADLSQRQRLRRALRSRPKLGRKMIRKITPTKVLIGAHVGSWAYKQYVNWTSTAPANGTLPAGAAGLDGEAAAVAGGTTTGTTTTGVVNGTEPLPLGLVQNGSLLLRPANESSSQQVVGANQTLISSAPAQATTATNSSRPVLDEDNEEEEDDDDDDT